MWPIGRDATISSQCNAACGNAQAWRVHRRRMPTYYVLKHLQDLHFAEDIEIPPEANAWSEAEAEAFFESGGKQRPQLKAAADAPKSVLTPRGVLRWLVDISEWKPGAEEWKLLLDLLPEADRVKVMRFKFAPDQQRALVSRLLQFRASVEVTGLRHNEVRIARCKGGKPFLSNRPQELDDTLPNWNFNVSHEGAFVALAAEPILLCGVDVAAPELARKAQGKRQTFAETAELMKSSFTLHEWAAIWANGPKESALEDAFRQYWSLKEAFVKGRGDGLGFELNRAEFTVQRVVDGAAGAATRTAHVAVDGKQDESWRFFVQPLKADHWISVGRGPPTHAVDAIGEFRASFRLPNPPPSAAARELQRAEPCFELKTIAQLLPPELQHAYYEASGRS